MENEFAVLPFPAIWHRAGEISRSFRVEFGDASVLQDFARVLPGDGGPVGNLTHGMLKYINNVGLMVGPPIFRSREKLENRNRQIENRTKRGTDTRSPERKLPLTRRSALVTLAIFL